MILLSVWLAAWLAVALMSVRWPGCGIAIALILGRQPFPNRSEPVIAAGPFVLILLVLALAASKRSPRIRFPSIAAGTLILLAGVVGLLNVPENPDIVGYGTEKGFLLILYVAPLVLVCSSALSDPRTLREFYLGVLVVGGALSAIGSVSILLQGERGGALGGGPITLAQLAALMLLLISNQEVRARVGRYPGDTWSTIPLIIAGSGAVILSASRGPLLALSLVLLKRLFSSEIDSKTRARIIFLAVVAVAVGFRLGAFRRLQLLINGFGGEATRSRGAVFSRGVEHMSEAGLLGRGFGSFITPTDSVVETSIRYAHNPLFELIGEVGWLVGGLLAVILILSCVAVLRRSRSSSSIWTEPVLFFLIASSLSGDLVNTRYLFLFLACHFVQKLDDREGKAHVAEPALPGVAARSAGASTQERGR